MEHSTVRALRNHHSDTTHYNQHLSIVSGERARFKIKGVIEHVSAETGILYTGTAGSKNSSLVGDFSPMKLAGLLDRYETR